MSAAAKKLLGLLESRYGVEPGFSRHLAPFLERFAAEEPSPEECEAMLRAIAAAYRACDPTGKAEGIEEVRVLLSQFVTEMRKLDETLKVLSAYLDRVRQRLYRSDPRRTLH
ncbi:MAG: hypothetical protein ACE5FG_07400 [Myxococcota bacterium]